MSVIFFDPASLGKLAAFAVGNMASNDGKQKLVRYIDALAQYSVENAAAFNATYGADEAGTAAVAWTAEEIGARVRGGFLVDDIKRILSTLDLLRYNLVSNGGEDFASNATLSALLRIALDVSRKTRSANLME